MPLSGAAIFTQELPWQKVPSGQGLLILEQGALIPLHSFAPQEDISVEVDMNPSEQNPPEHFCPIGQWLFARQGSLALPGDTMGTPALFTLLVRFNNTNAIIASINIDPRTEPSFIVSECM